MGNFKMGRFLARTGAGVLFAYFGARGCADSICLDAQTPENYTIESISDYAINYYAQNLESKLNN